MLDLICAIPENVGWVIVGALGAYALVWAHRLGKLLVNIWKDWHEEEA